MKSLARVALAVSLVSLAACQKANSGDDVNNTPDSTLPAMTTDVNADVTTNTTWSGLVKVHVGISVASGVTLTVDPGTVIQLDPSAGITVNGTVMINGAKGNVVTIGPATGNKYWRQWTVTTGTLNMNYVQQTGGAFSIGGAGKVIARDSEFSNAGSYPTDLLVASGGTIDMQYSWLGLPEGQADTTHCDMHFEGSAPLNLTISHTNVSTAAVAIMLYAGDANLTYNNWFGNSQDIDRTGTAKGDLSNGYFKKGNPTASASLTQNTMATAMVSDAGPR